MNPIPDSPARLAALALMWAPLLLAVSFAVTGLFVALRERVWRWRHARLSLGASVLEIAMPPKVDPGSASVWWSQLAGLASSGWKRWLFGHPHLAWEMVATQDGLRVQLWVPGTLNPLDAAKTIRATWPGASVTINPATPPLPAGAASAGGRMVVGQPDHYPLKTSHDADPLRSLLEAMHGLGAGQHLAVQILVRPVTGRRLYRAKLAASRLKNGQPSAKAALFDLVTPGPALRGAELARLRPDTSAKVGAILDKAADARFEVQILYTAATSRRLGQAAEPWLRGTADEIAAKFAVFSSGHQYLKRVRLRRPAAALASRRLNRGMLLSAAELAALAHLPHDLAAPGVTRAGARPIPPSPAILAAGTEARPVRILGDSEGAHVRPVAVGVTEGRQHLHVIGPTGVGKSALLAQLVLADARAGRGAVVIDPKGDLINDIIARLPERAIGTTVLFDPAQPGPPPSVNVLGGADPLFASDAIVTAFRRCFSSAWGPRLDDLMRSACMSLAYAHGPKARLSDVPLLLTDSAFRHRIVKRLAHDELLTGFWADYDQMSPSGRAAMVGPAMNKLRAVLLRPFILQSLSGKNPTVDLGQTLARGGLILARIPKGVLGEDATRLFGSLLVAHTWQAITPRSHLAEADRPDSALYLDECHNFLNIPGAISDILAEARGYRLAMVLAHQHLSQLPKDLREALSADARNKIYFGLSPEDAADLSRHTHPHLSAHDLSHLAAYQAAGRLLVDNRTEAAFTFRTRPLPAPIPDRAEAIRISSREYYTAPPAEPPKPLPGGDPDDRPGLRLGTPKPTEPHTDHSPATAKENRS